MEQKVKEFLEGRFEKEIEWEARQEERLRGLCARFFQNTCKKYIEKGAASPLYGFLKAEYDREARRTVLEYETLRGKEEGRAREMLLSFRPGKKNRAFYMELYLNEYAYEKGYITAVEFYVWLVEYLDATTDGMREGAAGTKTKKNKLHSMYYLDERLNSIYAGEAANRDGRYAYEWLYPLLAFGLGRETEEIKKRVVPNWNDASEKKSKKSIRKQEFEKLLEELNDKLHGEEGEEARKRLEGLPEGYLKELTRMLKKMALYWKIVEFFEGNGHPLYLERVVSENGEEERFWNIKVRLPEKVRSRVPELAAGPAETTGKKRGRPSLAEKSKEKNYREPGRELCLALDQMKGNGGGTKDGFLYHIGSDTNAAGESAALLMDELNQSMKDADAEGSCVFVPLVTDVVSGCVLAIVGKQNYKELYERYAKKYPENGKPADAASKNCYMAFREDYAAFLKEDGKKCCIDILYLNVQDYRNNPITPRGAYMLLPRFHRNVGKGYGELLEEFLKYCTIDDYYETVSTEGRLPVWLEKEEWPGCCGKGTGFSVRPETPRKAVLYRNPLLDDMDAGVLKKLPRELKNYFCKA